MTSLPYPLAALACILPVWYLFFGFAWNSPDLGSGRVKTISAIPIQVKAAPPATAPWQTRPMGKAEQGLVKAGLVDVQQVDKSLLVDLKYSTTDNFVGLDVYGDLERAYLQPEVARKLAKAHTYLRAKHPDLRLLVYDAARPRSIQQILWDTLQVPLAEKPKYVANPQSGSVHNFGAAVDLTLARADGQPLDMGTPFDYFGELAYPTKEAEMLRLGRLNREQVQNRQLLRQVMRRAGFSGLETEWWHFNALSREQAKERYGIIE
jgi:zinc D-Ala-D-Ala dipeptidase